MCDPAFVRIRFKAYSHASETSLRRASLPMKQFKFLLFLVAFLVVILGVFQVVISSQIATEGKGQKSLEEEKAKLLEENTFLKNELARLYSISSLEKKALEAGFVRASQVMYLTPQVPVAQIPQAR